MNAAEAESRSLEDLVGALEGRIRAAASRFALDAADVDEVLQDVRIRVWKARGAGARAGVTSGGYVHRAAVSAALDLLRRRRRRRTEALPESLPVPEAEGPERALEAGGVREAIEAALEGLSDRRRPVVRMYLAGYGSGEIAQLMGWSEATARNLLYRGLEELRGALSAKGYGPGRGGEGESGEPDRASLGAGRSDAGSAQGRGDRVP